MHVRRAWLELEIATDSGDNVSNQGGKHLG